MSEFHKLRVKDVINETESCVTILFEVEEELKENFKFTAGQYLTIKGEIGGEEVRRAYSICTGKSDNEVGVSVKKVEGGKCQPF